MHTYLILLRGGWNRPFLKKSNSIVAEGSAHLYLVYPRTYIQVLRYSGAGCSVSPLPPLGIFPPHGLKTCFYWCFSRKWEEEAFVMLSIWSMFVYFPGDEIQSEPKWLHIQFLASDLLRPAGRVCFTNTAKWMRGAPSSAHQEWRRWHTLILFVLGRAGRGTGREGRQGR